MLNLAAVALGDLNGAAGALLRYGLSTLLYRYLGTGFPYGTLAVNVLGSALMGVVFVLVQERGLPDAWRLAVAVGLLGAFTTFSTFSLDTLVLLDEGALGRAVLNVMLSVFLCLGAAALGMMVARSL